MTALIQMLMLVFFITAMLAKVETHGSAPKKMYRSQAEELRLQEKRRRDEINIYNSSYSSFNFRLNRSSDFILKPEQDQEIKAVLDVYWRQNNVYLKAAVLNEERIAMKIESSDGKIVVSEFFYTGTGVRFKVERSKTYKISLGENGNYTKIVMMHLSEVSALKSTAKVKEMAELQAKLLVAQQKLANGLKLASAGLLMSQRTNDQILGKSRLYSHFEIFETLFILTAAFVEFKLVTNLFKEDIVV